MSGVRLFERMVGFHVAALLRGAPSPAQSLCLIQTFARITSRITEDAEDDAEGSYTCAEQLAADLVVHTARGAAGREAVKEASQLIAPKGVPECPLGHMLRFQTRLTLGHPTLVL